ncbi:MAG: response regulator [Chthoniobacterales bacterium]
MPDVPSSSPTTTFEDLPHGILLVEEYSALAAAIASALHKFAPFHSVQVAPSFAEAEILAAKMQPELFVLDLDPPPLGEVEFLGKLRAHYPESRLLVIAAGTARELRAARGTAGAIQFVEKPFDLAEFGAAIQALLGPRGLGNGLRGTLRDLNVIDIAQMKCIGLSTSVLHLTGPGGRTGEIHFQKGQITHAAAGRKIGVAALEEIAAWSGGDLKETELPGDAVRTIDIPWPVLLLPIVRQIAERERTKPSGAAVRQTPPGAPPREKILVIDDTEMLLIFVADVLATADPTFQITTAPTGAEGLRVAATVQPDLVLLDYSLTDTTGDKVCRALLENELTARIPVLMMSGHLTELAQTAKDYRNVVATLPKPFLSGALINAVEKALAGGWLPKVAPNKPKPKPVPSVPTAPTDVLMPRLPNGHDPGSDDLPAEPPPTEPPTASEPSKAVVDDPLAETEPPTHAATEPPAGAPPLSAQPTEPAPKEQAPAPATDGGIAATFARQAELNVTFSLEVAAVQLTPLLQVRAVRLRPYSRVVAAQLSEPKERTGANLATGFHLGPFQLGANGKIETVRLLPTRQPIQLPTVANSLAINSINFQPANSHRNLELVAGSGEAMRVQLTAPFELARVELSPGFEIEAIFVRARNTQVLVRNSAAGQGMSFELREVELDPAGELRALLVEPSA